MTYLKNFIRDEEGQDMVEYALLLGLIALVAVVASHCPRHLHQH